MSGATVYLTKLSHEEFQRWMSVKSHVLGQMGIKEAQVGTAENFITLANALYDLNIPTGNFPVAIDLLFTAIRGISKTARRKLRKKNVGKLGYECRPHAKVVKAAAIKPPRRPGKSGRRTPRNLRLQRPIRTSTWSS
jgi:hypothetical protein